MKQNTKEVSETTALGYLGGRTKAIRADLRNLPHKIIDRGRRMSQARLYQVEDVLKLRRARSEKWQHELALLKKNDKHAMECRAKIVSMPITAPCRPQTRHRLTK
jgi:hypothetical protein